MYDKSKRRKRRHNTRRCKRKLKKMYNNGYGAVCEFDEDSRGRTVATPYYCRCYKKQNVFILQETHKSKSKAL